MHLKCLETMFRYKTWERIFSSFFNLAPVKKVGFLKSQQFNNCNSSFARQPFRTLAQSFIKTHFFVEIKQMKNVTNKRSQSKSLLEPERCRAQTKYNIRIYAKNAYLYEFKISFNFLFTLN